MAQLLVGCITSSFVGPIPHRVLPYHPKDAFTSFVHLVVPPILTPSVAKHQVYEGKRSRLCRAKLELVCSSSAIFVLLAAGSACQDFFPTHNNS